VFIESDANHKLSGLWCQSLIASTCRQQSSTCTEAAGETDVQTELSGWGRSSRAQDDIKSWRQVDKSSLTRRKLDSLAPTAASGEQTTTTQSSLVVQLQPGSSWSLVSAGCQSDVASPASWQDPSSHSLRRQPRWSKAVYRKVQYTL